MVRLRSRMSPRLLIHPSSEHGEDGPTAEPQGHGGPPRMEEENLDQRRRGVWRFQWSCKDQENLLLGQRFTNLVSVVKVPLERKSNKAAMRTKEF